MANNNFNEQTSTWSGNPNPSYAGRLQENKTPQSNYPGRVKDGGADIGMSGKNKSKDIGLTKDSKGLSANESGRKSGYDSNDSM